MFDPGIHIIAADHGAGNTITALNIAKAVEEGAPIFGRPNKMEPGPVLYVSLKSNAVKGFLSDASSCIAQDKFSAENLANWMTKKPDTKLIVLDPAHLTVPSQSVNAGAEVSEWFDKIRLTAIKYNVPVLLVHFLTKFTKGIARERIAGCAYWSSAMRTRTTVERLAADLETQDRCLYHYPEAGPPIEYHFKIRDSGVWETLNTTGRGVEYYIEQQPQGYLFTTAELHEMLDEQGVNSRASKNRRIAKWVEEGLIRSHGNSKGKYEKIAHTSKGGGQTIQ